VGIFPFAGNFQHNTRPGTFPDFSPRAITKDSMSLNLIFALVGVAKIAVNVFLCFDFIKNGSILCHCFQVGFLAGKQY